MISSKRLSLVPCTAAFLAGTILGATGIFLFDPVRGRARRAMLRDKTLKLGRDTLRQSEKIARDLANRSKGLMIEAKQTFKSNKSNPPVRAATLLSDPQDQPRASF